MIVWNYHLHRH